MLIALDRHQHFRASKRVRQWRRAVWLRLVPVGIVLWREVNVVLRRIAVGNVQLLIDHGTQHMWSVVTAVLIERDAGRRRGKSVFAHLRAVGRRAILDINKSIGQLAVGYDVVFSCEVRALL